MDKRMLCLKFDAELLKQMKIKAIEQDVTLTELLERLMRDYLEKGY